MNSLLLRNGSGSGLLADDDEVLERPRSEDGSERNLFGDLDSLLLLMVLIIGEGCNSVVVVVVLLLLL
jgi:hypothetical protein